MAQVGSLVVDLIANTASFNSNIEKAAATLNGNAAKIKRSLNEIGETVKGTVEKAKLLGEAFAVAELAEAIKSSLEFAAAMKIQAQQIGITAEQMQALHIAAGRVGTSQEEVDTGMKRFTVTLGKAQLGAKAQRDELKALGVDYHATTTVALAQFSDKLATVGNDSKRHALEVLAMGRSAVALDPLLRQGAAGLDEIRKSAEEAGLILSDKLTEDAHRASVAIEELTLKLKVSFASEVAQNAGSIIGLVDALDKFVDISNAVIAKVPALGNALSEIAKSLPLLNPLGTLANLAMTTIGKPYYDKNESTDLATRTRYLNAATSKTEYMISTGEYRRNPTAFAAQRQALEDQRRLMSKAQMVNAPAPKPAGGDDIPPFLASKGHAPHDKTAEYLKQFTDQNAQLDAQLLEAKKANTVDAGKIADFERQSVDVEATKLHKDLEINASKNPILAAHKSELDAKIEQVRAQKQLTISTDELEKRSQELLAVQLAAGVNQRDVLNASLALAVTGKDRRDLSLRLLDLDKQEERAKLEAITASNTATDAEKQIAQMRLKSLDQLYDLRAQDVRQQTRSPLEQYLADNDPKLLSDKVERLEVAELDSVRNGIDDAITSKLGIKDPLLKGLIDLFIQTQLINPIAEALQKARANSGGGGGGLLGSLFKIGGSLLGGISGGTVARLTPSATSTIAANPGGIFASGGFVRGPGGPTSDSIHAMLSNGEFVLNAAAVRSLGVSNLDMLNKGAGPRFAMGGLVGPMPSFAARNDNFGGRPIEAHFHFAPGMNERERRETSGQAMRALRQEIGRSVKMGM